MEPKSIENLHNINLHDIHLYTSECKALWWGETEEVPSFANVAHTHAFAWIQTARELVDRIQTDQTQRTRAFSLSQWQCVLCVCTHWLECNQQFVLEVCLQTASQSVAFWSIYLDSPWILNDEARAPRQWDNPSLTYCLQASAINQVCSSSDVTPASNARQPIKLVRTCYDTHCCIQSCSWQAQEKIIGRTYGTRIHTVWQRYQPYNTL